MSDIQITKPCRICGGWDFIRWATQLDYDGRVAYRWYLPVKERVVVVHMQCVSCLDGCQRLFDGCDLPHDDPAVFIELIALFDKLNEFRQAQE